MTSVGMLDKTCFKGKDLDWSHKKIKRSVSVFHVKTLFL